MLRVKIVIFISCFLLMVSEAWCVTVDLNAQELQKKDERDRILREKQEQRPNVRLTSPLPAAHEKFPENESPCFQIKSIKLKGDDGNNFGWSLSDFIDGSQRVIGQCVGASGINLILRTVQNSIVEKGFIITRILAEPQDLRSGELVLTIIPGRVRAIRFTDRTSYAASKWNAVPIRSGEVLNLRDVEQALENFKRLPTVDADIQIEPGTLPGESDLVIDWVQKTPFRLSVSLDDSGSDATGKYQGTVTLSHDNLLMLNDLLYISRNQAVLNGGSTENGARGFSFHYSAPYDYWLAGVTVAGYRFHQKVAGANQSYVYSGESHNSDLKLSNIVYRNSRRKITFYLSGYFKKSSNFIDDTEVEVQRRRTSGWSIGLEHKEFIGKSSLDSALAFRHGSGAMGALTAPEETQTEGSSRPQIATANISVYTPFNIAGQGFRYGGLWRAQWNRTGLISQDRFSIGGRNTVRGFDGEYTLSAERGWLVRNDFGWNINGYGQEMYVGVDYGKVGGANSRNLIGSKLAGAGLGMRGSMIGLQYDFFAGKPISKPDGLKTAKTAFGFNLDWSF